MKFTIRDLTRQAMIAAVYIVLVYIFQALSFNDIQFRIAEVLLIFVFFDKKSIVGLTLGTFIANWLLSPFGIIDAAVGGLATLLALLGMMLFKKVPYIALIIPAITNGLLVGLLLYYMADLPFWTSALWVSLGEVSVCYVIGLPLYYILRKYHFLENENN